MYTLLNILFTQVSRICLRNDLENLSADEAAKIAYSNFYDAPQHMVLPWQRKFNILLEISSFYQRVKRRSFCF